MKWYFLLAIVIAAVVVGILIDRYALPHASKEEVKETPTAPVATDVKPATTDAKPTA